MFNSVLQKRAGKVSALSFCLRTESEAGQPIACGIYSLLGRRLMPIWEHKWRLSQTDSLSDSLSLSLSLSLRLMVRYGASLYVILILASCQVFGLPSLSLLQSNSRSCWRCRFILRFYGSDTEKSHGDRHIALSHSISFKKLLRLWLLASSSLLSLALFCLQKRKSVSQSLDFRLSMKCMTCHQAA